MPAGEGLITYIIYITDIAHITYTFITYIAGEGLITYMRTDGVQLSEEAVGTLRETVKDMFGPQFLPDKPRRVNVCDGASLCCWPIIRYMVW